MLRRYETLYSPAVGRHMQMLAFGHFGAPVIAFPSGGGQFYDFEDNGMIGAVADLIEAGKIKIYCPEGLDNESWLNREIDPHWRAVRHGAYQDFIVHNLIPAIRNDCRQPDVAVGVTGCSLGAYHAVNFALKFPHLFNFALGLSGRYDLESIVGKNGSADVYFNNPIAYVANLHGDALDHVRRHLHVVLVCGQGAWEEKCLHETHRLADLFADKGISHQRDIWGLDVEHHWFWWRKQITHHLGMRYGD
ncbi:MAG: esterase family protein [Caldilineaceae bacterium]|nr:esterase family protein [Caldilineaceae bacterium]